MKTAVEWLIDELTDDPSKFLFLCDKSEYMDELIKIVQKAKEMEYEQLLKSFNFGKYNAITSNDLDEKRTFEWFYKNIKNEI